MGRSMSTFPFLWNPQLGTVTAVSVGTDSIHPSEIHFISGETGAPPPQRHHISVLREQLGYNLKEC